MAQAVAAATVLASVGSLVAGRQQATSQRRSQRALVAEQKKTQAEERSRLNREEAETTRRQASRESALLGRLGRGRGATLFAGQRGVTTSKLGGGS